MRESLIEKAVSDYGRSKGWIVWKFRSPANKAVPDRIFLRSEVTFFIEFKATGKKPTKLQLWTHEKLRDQGFKVYVVDDIDQGKQIINSYED